MQVAIKVFKKNKHIDNFSAQEKVNGAREQASIYFRVK